MTYSRWYLCELHTHSPADAQQRYGDVGGRDPNPAFARKLVEAHAAAGVKVLAITDHNRVDWYPVLREAGDAVGVTVFPGLEFSVNRCHLLAIWDATDAGYKRAEEFLAYLYKPGELRFQDNGDPRPVPHGQVLQHAEVVRDDYHGLVFAPHTTRSSIGLFARGVCANKDAVAQSELITGFDAWGSSGADVLRNPRAYFGEVAPRWFVSGDVRSFDEVGRRAVWLKLGAAPDLEGLRQAFLAPATRIRFPAHLEQDWREVAGAQFAENPDPTWPRLTRITVRGGFHDGLDIDLAPGLTTLIGGRGTGKSAAIEILRHTLEAGEPDEPLRKIRQHTFPLDADADVAFVDAEGTAYVAQRTGGPEPGPAQLLRSGEPVEVAVPRRLPIRVYGQRELQQLGLSLNKRYDFLANQAGPDWQKLFEAEQEVTHQLRLNSKELDQLEQDIERMSNAALELNDLNEKLTLAREQDADSLLDQSQALETAATEVDSALGWIAQGREGVEALQSRLPRPQLPQHPGVPHGLGEVLDETAALISRTAANLARDLDEIDRRLDAEKHAWDANLRDHRENLHGKLTEAGVHNPQQLADWQSDAAHLQQQTATLSVTRDKHDADLRKRSELLDELNRIRREKSRVIGNVARRLSGQVLPRARIRATPSSDHSALQTALKEQTRGQHVQSDQLARLSRQVAPTLVQAIRQGPEAIAKLGCTSTTAEKLGALPETTLRDLEEVDTPDLVEIEINLSLTEAAAWYSVVNVSPGQCATALLALVLASSNEPLVIDQPEDDLDNRFIYDEIVQLLAEVCQRRQVIVATHNANIPILGDAELVVALDAEASKGRVLATGGIEDPKVAECARHILEGGDEAFRRRQQRYLATQSPKV